MPELPEKFLERMEKLLGPDEYQEFLKSYESEPRKGIRANTLKIDREGLKERLAESEMEPSDIAWCPDGLYINPESRPGKQPEYYTGLYYPQEPSAMSSAQALPVEEGEVVLDLCAAPGGKSTQIAAKLNGTGLLVANEIMKGRVGTLASNLERMGVANAVVLNEDPRYLEKDFALFFDKILIDAPCSGEGMFRKDEAVRDEWTEERPGLNAARQRNILASANKMLKPGGELVYSTCTFAPEENEEIVEWMVGEMDYEAVPVELEGIETTGRPEFTESGESSVANTVRIWPHRNEGEGHFVARLRKPGDKTKKVHRPKKRVKNQQIMLKRAGGKEFENFLEFRKKYMPDFKLKRSYIFRDKLITMPDEITPKDLAGLKVQSAGLMLGELKPNRFEPSHSLAMALKKDEFTNTYEMDREELWDYLKGLEITPKGEVSPGWVLMCYEGYPVGFGKMSTAIKNKYPKGLRIRKK